MFERINKGGSLRESENKLEDKLRTCLLLLLIDPKVSQGLGQPVGWQAQAGGSGVPPPQVSLFGRFVFTWSGGVRLWRKKHKCL